MNKIYLENGVIEILDRDLLVTLDGFSGIIIPMSSRESDYTYTNAIETIISQATVLGKRQIQTKVRKTLGV